MRYTLLPSLSISFCLIVIWPNKFFNCEDSCQELQEYDKVIFENVSYRYSIHNKYSMRIRRHQLHPVVKGDFEEVTSEQTVIPKFSFEYYNNHVDHFNISPTGVINFPVGLVTFTMPEIQSSQLQILNEEPINPEITVPSKWIKSGTLVEFEVIRTLCSIHTTKEACRKATPLDTTCIWCGKAGECIESNDQDTHMLKVNDCNDERLTLRLHKHTSKKLKEHLMSMMSRLKKTSRNLPKKMLHTW
ncbi:unnamed protein product [Schistosoma rodhaini]|nr:unnamed protein product [Schistosoma rodhaini]